MVNYLQLILFVLVSQGVIILLLLYELVNLNVLVLHLGQQLLVINLQLTDQSFLLRIVSPLLDELLLELLEVKENVLYRVLALADLAMLHVHVFAESLHLAPVFGVVLYHIIQKIYFFNFYKKSIFTIKKIFFIIFIENAWIQKINKNLYKVLLKF